MKLIKTLFVSLTFFITVNPAIAESVRIMDKGIDGNKRHYDVSCPDGNSSSIAVIFDNPEAFEQTMPEEQRKARTGGSTLREPRITQVCIYPHKGEEQCRPQWELDQAAAASCPR
jgi:hypothetical protein